MIFANFAIGIPTMMLCLILQVTFTYCGVRYAVRCARAPDAGLLLGIRALLIAMVIMMLGNFLQIMLWGALFSSLGEFEEFYEAVYHSAVNFTSLGYGDVVMTKQRKLLGPLEALNGVVMLGMSGAALVTILQHLTRRQMQAGKRQGQAADDVG
ncbi:MAG TPA: ion channel [Accumulibacter sp.]|uniref:ion channel n=1 Tax=Accumulibacter sp. TaxID=2053492 RepID=UPI0025F963EC|nr:ion channel [Accumulibacter sp.]MCM8597196.1 potassium channel family protein [Accumulibacter sp.]MCM8661543.1 potassium channel family protein [Accumulibacter sp.]HNC53322.1 ion channel [Accumulibacter sp.]